MKDRTVGNFSSFSSEVKKSCSGQGEWKWPVKTSKVYRVDTDDYRRRRKRTRSGLQSGESSNRTKRSDVTFLRCFESTTPNVPGIANHPCVPVRPLCLDKLWQRNISFCSWRSFKRKPLQSLWSASWTILANSAHSLSLLVAMVVFSIVLPFRF